MGPIGGQEMIVIALLALLLFGPKKLPELGRMLGKGLSEFRRAKNELKSTFESHMQELDREARASEKPKSTAEAPTPQSSYPSASYPYPYDEYGRESSSYSSSAEPYGHSVSPPPIHSAENGNEGGNSWSEPSAETSLPVSGTVPRSKFRGSIEEDRPA